MKSPPASPRGRPRLVATLFGISTITALVTSLGAPLVPQISATYSVSLDDAQWTLTVALLAGVVATPILGRLGDGPHARVSVLATLAVVLAGLVVAAAAPNVGVLIAARACQGLGIGVTPVAMAVARRAMAGRDASRTIALLSVSTVAGAGLGYPLTALVADVWGARSAYGAGAVLCLLALVAAFLTLPATNLPSARFDLIGTLSMCAGTVATLVLLSEGIGWSWGQRGVATAIGIVGIGGWCVRSFRISYPLIDLRLAVSRAIVSTHVTAVMAGSGMYALLSTVMLFVQSPRSAGGLGQSVFVAGILLTPYALTSVLGNRAARALGRAASPSVTLVIGCIAYVTVCGVIVLMPHHLAVLLVAMAIAGIGGGCIFAVLPWVIAEAVPTSQTGSALALNQWLKFIGFAAGSAFVSALFAAHTPRGERLPTPDAYDMALVATAAMWALAGVIAWLLRPPPSAPEN